MEKQILVALIIVTFRCTQSEMTVSQHLTTLENVNDVSLPEISGNHNFLQEVTLIDTSRLDLKNALATTKSNYLMEDPLRSKICEICSCQDNAVFAIDCNNKNLENNFLAPEWPQVPLSSSIEAKFESNKITEINQFPDLPLIKLSYRQNAIGVVQKAAFKFLKDLEYLDLSENLLTHESIKGSIFEGKYDEEDYEPIPLKTLKLSYNRISSIDKDAFNHLSSHLEILELDNNPLKVIDHQTAIAITTLRKLKTLNLTETNLAAIPNGFFHALPALKILNLSGNQFTVIPEELQRAIHLEFLNFNNNPITLLNAESFQGLTQLKHLNISNMPLLERIDANTFTSLESVTRIFCSFNPRLQEIHPGAFNNMKEREGNFQLNEFYLRGNNLTNLPHSLLPWNSLELVDIAENPLKCDCNIGWIVTDFLPIFSERTPELTSHSLKCATPEKYMDRFLESLKNNTDIVNCTNPPDSISNNAGIRANSSDVLHSPSSKGLIIASTFGIISVVGGMSCFVLLAVKKSPLRQLYDPHSGQIVHYCRAASGTGKPEDEQVIVEKEYNQYYEEP